MDLTVDEFIEGLFSKEAHEQPSDSKHPEDNMNLPPWYDEKKFNRGRRFYWSFCFAFTSSMIYGLVAVFSIPSILKVLMGSRRSNSTYTAYKRYLSTILHTVSWFENDLHPGTRSWKSLSTVRSRHFRAGQSSKLKGHGHVSQRDLALTLFGFFGFSLIKSDVFSIRQLEEGDWDAYLHFWRTIGYAIGLEDRYNLSRKTVEETREVCEILCDKVFTPSLCNVPEYFEHMARVMLEGITSVNPTIDVEASIFTTRYLANVPGYVYTEKDRLDIQRRIREHSPKKSEDGLANFAVDASALISKPLIELQPAQPQILHYHDYDTVESSPHYKRLHSTSKYRLNYNVIFYAFYSSFVFRFIFNMLFRYIVFLMKYFPYLAFFKHGIKASYVNIFVEDPTDDEQVKPNSEYQKPQTGSWLRCIFNSF